MDVLKVFIELEKLRFSLQDTMEELQKVKRLFAELEHDHIIVRCSCGEWEGCLICQNGYCPKCNHYIIDLKNLFFCSNCLRWVNGKCTEITVDKHRIFPLCLIRKEKV